MQLDNALRLAVILSWDDIQKVPNSCSVRVEYQKEVGIPLDYLSVWSDRLKSFQFLICSYRAMTSDCAGEARFANGYHFDGFAERLDFIMENQDRFTRPADASRHGLVLIYPPSDEDRAQATAWMKETLGRAN